MTALIASEWLKLRTTRTAIGMTLALVALVALGVSAIVGATSDDDLAAEDWPGVLADTAGVATIFALLLGILLISGEYRHGTITSTFLVSPRRGRVLSAKLLVAGGAGVALALLAAAVAAAIGLPWLDARDVDVSTSELGRNVGGLLVSCAFWGALGVGVGALLRNQVLAIVVALLWLLVAEPLVGLLLDFAGVDEAVRYLPQAAIGALLGSADVDDPLPRLVGGGVALAYVIGVAGSGYLVTTRRDIT